MSYAVNSPRRIGPFSGLRGRLVALVLLTIAPLIALQLHELDNRQHEQIAAAQHRALVLARLAGEKQAGLITEARDLLEVMSRVAVLQGEDVAGCTAFLTDLTARHRWIISARVNKPDGTGLCRDADFATMANLGDRDYFKTAVATKQFVLSGYIFGHSTKRPAIAAILPVLDPAGAVVRVLALTLDLASLNADAVMMGKEPGLETTIVDGDGIVLAREPAAAKLVGGSLPESHLFSAVMAQPEGEVELTDFDGVSRLYGFARVNGTPNRIIVGLRRDFALHQVNADYRRSLLILCVIAVLAVGAAWLLCEILVLRGVRLLTRFADRIGAGDLEARPGRMSGELGGLAGALSEMADRLKRRDRQLQEATSAAETAGRAKAEFMAAMSHEIRTPLNGIIGFAGLLHGTELTEKQRKFTTLLKDAGQSLLAIINDILDFSKIEAGKLDLEEIEFPLAELVEGCQELVAKAASDKGLELQILVPPDVPRHLKGDPGRLRQVLLNLLNNAVKFTKEGSVVLSVTRIGEQSGKPQIKFLIADTGIGIPAEKQGLLFEQFSQVDRTISRQFGGTGLGLAISRRLVTLMGGEIGFESTPGRGSTFWFTTMLSLGEERAGAAAADGGAVVAFRRPARILLVEDLPMNQILAEAILRDAGHTIVTAADGAEALSAVQRESFDLVLMDVQMPVMDGLAATRAIRALPGETGRLPILAMTANALPEEVARCRAAGMDDHIAKPIDVELLLAAVERWRGNGERAGSVSPRSETAAILDEETIARLDALLGRERLHELVKRFLADLPVHLDSVARSPGDHERVGREAHAMVSVAGNFGLGELTAASRALMQACRDPAKPDLARPVAAFTEAARRATKAMERIEQAMSADAASSRSANFAARG